MIGMQEMIVIGIIAIILIFGARKFGDIGTGLGEGIRNFKRSMRDDPKDNGGNEPRGPEPR